LSTSAIEAPQAIGDRSEAVDRRQPLFASMFDDHTIDTVYLMNAAGAGVGS
jgi:hypothetical protein